MHKAALFCFIAFALLSRTAFSNPACSNLVETSRDLVSNLFLSLAVGNEAGVRNDFITFENQLQELRLCSAFLSSSVYVQSIPETATCQSVMDSLLQNVEKFLNKKTSDETETINMLRYLMEQSSVFSSVCKLNTQVQVQNKIRASPTPECLSQIYQTLSTLYSVGVDAMNQDATDLESDFEALSPITDSINTLCGQEIVFDNTTPGDGNCDNDFTSISNVISTYSNSDPTDPSNILQTLQDLWSLYPNFKNDCITSKQQPVVVAQPVAPKATTPECLSEIYQLLSTLYSISVDAMNQDATDLESDFEDLSPLTDSINTLCGQEIVVDGPVTSDGNCNNDFTAISNVMDTFNKGNPIDSTNVLQTLESLWSLYPNFKNDCLPSKAPVVVVEPTRKNLVPLSNEGDASPQCLNIYADAMQMLLAIFKDASANDSNKLADDFKSLGSTIFAINSNCEPKLHVKLFTDMGVSQMSCRNAAEAMKEIFVDESLERVDIVQKVWAMRHSLMNGC